MTQKRHTLGLIAVCTLIILSGCSGEQVWSLSVRGTGDQVDDEFVFDGTVELGGHTGEVAVHDVRVVFIAENDTTLRTVYIGRLNSSHELENITATLDSPPEYVRVMASQIESPNDARYHFSGVRRTDGGGYSPYTQNLTEEWGNQANSR